MSAESHAGLQEWFAKAKTTPECILALKHRNTMPTEAVAEFKAAYPDDGADDNERELALVFALTQHAEALNTVTLLLANLKIVAPEIVIPVTHVDPAPEPFAAVQDEPAK